MDELADPVLASYRALNERDIEGALAPLDEHAVWQESAELPGGGELRGKDAIKAFLREFLDTWSDFRQEIDYPVSAGQFRIVPYVLGRYTAYSDSPDQGTQNRVFLG